MEEHKTTASAVLIAALVVVLIAAAVAAYFYYKGDRSEEENTNENQGKSAVEEESNGNGNNQEESGSGQYAGLILYHSDCCGFQYYYPESWEITDNYFYETPAGEKAKVPTIVMAKSGEDSKTETNKIWINMRQSECMLSGATKSTLDIEGVEADVYSLSGSSESCIEAQVKGQDSDGKKVDFDIMSYYNKTDVLEAFKKVVSTFESAPL